VNRKVALLLTLVLLVGLMPALPTLAQDPLIESVCLITDVGRVNDGTFNQFAYKGMVDAVEDFDLDSTYIETTGQVDYATNIQTCVDSGYGAIITVGFLITDATLAAAQANPEVYFIGVDHFYMDAPPNLVGVLFREDQSGFMAGALAGLMTMSDIVAGVYGIDIPPVIRFRHGFENGVHFTNMDAQALGVYIPSFVDPATGAETALQFIAEGADVIFGAGGPTGSGGIQAAAAKGVFVIGVDQDEYVTTFGNGESPGADMVISSAMKRVDQGVYLSLKELAEGDAMSFGGNTVLSAANDGVGLAPSHDADVPDEVLAQLDEIFAGLQDGSISTGVDPITGEMLMDDMMDDDMMMSATATVTAANLNVRSGPGLDYDVLAVISRDSSYPALGRNEDGSWVEIDVDGTVGWVSAEWVEVAPSVDDLMVVDMMMEEDDMMDDDMSDDDMDDDEMMDEDEEMSDDDSGG
jgi:basic membrane lipoprotein Med (substrate-binding protein (PBP1-ABC) superfamily)